MVDTQRTDQLEIFEVGRQQVTMTFDGGSVVSDAGLLPIRELDTKLGILGRSRSTNAGSPVRNRGHSYCRRYSHSTGLLDSGRLPGWQ